MPVRRVYLV